MSENFEFFVLNPAGLPDPALAIAGSRAGATGIVNLEFAGAGFDLTGVVDAMVRHASGSFGIKLDAGRLDQIAPVLNGPPAGFRVVIVDADAARAAATPLDAFRAGGGRVLVEITAWTEDLGELAARIDGWWAKGHEAGGRIGEVCSFVLAQELARRTPLPFFVRGGINVHSAPAASVLGAAGVVLDDQLLLLRDSPLAAGLAQKLAYYTGTDGIVVDDETGHRHLRLWLPPGDRTARAARDACLADPAAFLDGDAVLAWRADEDQGGLRPLGQDGASAAFFARQFKTVAQAVRALRAVVTDRPGEALRLNLLGEETPLARAHGTRLPIVQGPMTHVSDRPAFTRAVSAAGALPMVAVSLMRGDAVATLMKETKETLGDLPWGVGLLGFVPADIQADQRAAIAANPPRYAIIAGGRPDQAQELERAGILTYIHVPSSILLTQFLEQGARNFIFEGRECGGHVGPLGSFSLWGAMIDALLAHDIVRREPDRVRVLFAGGIHDAPSAAAAATMAAPLAAAGVGVGFLMGTGYIFTREAVESGAITPAFQRTAVECTRTDRLTTGPGHASRCANSLFVSAFWQRRRELEAEGRDGHAIHEELETLSLGRLRMATKGLYRLNPDSRELSAVSESDQVAGGMYMIGQVATLRDQAITVDDLHQAVSEEAISHLARFAGIPSSHRQTRAAPPPADVAVIGIGVLLPQSASARRYWQNILAGFNAVTEVPAERWDWRLYFDADRRARDRIYSRWGGFVDPVPFDPMVWGIPPMAVDAIDPFQLMTLELVRQALTDAGYDMTDIREREETSIILGFSGGLGEHGILYGLRSELKRFADLDGEGTPYAALPEWTEDSFAGLLPNVAAGRVANRLNFGGVNFSVDAACASSLTAVHEAVMQLETGRSDLVIAGGIDTLQSPFGFMCFSKSQALSPTGRSATFDAGSDGITISEGLALVVLKRLADAERDGDRIYAVIKGVGGSSDGRAKGMMAPLPAGQQRALRRAYAQAGYSPATLDLVEAHGTGTVAGDSAELDTVTSILRRAGAGKASCAIGSVKTNIGHTKAAAGVAGMIKAVLGLYHKTIPPHRGVETPNPGLTEPDSPIYLSQLPRPWVRHPDHPRRAGVSSFGFGGTNFHVTLEEYEGEFRSWVRPAPLDDWPCELFVWRAADRDALISALTAMAAVLEHENRPPLAAIAKALAGSLPDNGLTAAIVAESAEALKTRIGHVVKALGTSNGAVPMPPGAYITPAFATAGRVAGKVAVLFSGQGSQYPDMLREVAVVFEEVGRALEEADAVTIETPTFAADGEARLSRQIYPPERFSPDEEAAARAALTRTQIAQPALGAVEIGLWRLLDALGVEADMMAGHSYGEYVALHAAGVLSTRDLLLTSEARGRFIAAAAAGGELGTMAAVMADGEAVAGALGDRPEIVLANFNGPMQTVISGSRAAVEAAVRDLEGKGLEVKMLPVAAAFHSPLMAPAREPLAAFLDRLGWAAPCCPVYANVTGRPHAGDPDAIRAQMADHLIQPVRFVQTIQAMHDDGARVFLEVGPKSVFSDLVRSILGDRPHVAAALDGTGGGLKGFLNGLAALVAAGLPVRLDRLFRGRAVPTVRLDRPETWAKETPLPGHVWLVTGSSAGRPGQPSRRQPVAIAARTERQDPQNKENVQGFETRSIGSQPPERLWAEPSWFAEPEDPLPLAGRHGTEELWQMDGNRPFSGYGTSTDQVMAAYHQTMLQFLRMQERVMTAYLGAPSNGDGRDAHMFEEVPMAPFAETGETGFLDPAAAAAGMPRPIAQPRPATAEPANGGAGTPAAPQQAAAPALQPVPEPALAAAPATEVAEAPAPAAAAPDIDRKALFLQLISERTGYPEDMLGLDQDIEADLGIDSIKRVEILGAFRDALPKAMSEKLADGVQAMVKARSIQAILDLMTERLGEGTQRPFDSAGEEEREPASAPLPRYVTRALAEPADGLARRPLLPGVYVITADDAGVSEALAARLTVEGVIPVIIAGRTLADESSLGGWLVEQKSRGPLRAVIHLAPLSGGDAPAEGDLAAWRARVQSDVKALFPLLRLAAGDLGEDGSVIAASAMGGQFGRDFSAGSAVPWTALIGGGNVGLLKSLSLEWERARLKAVDLDTHEPAQRLAEHILMELTLAGGRREVGYPSGVRTIFRTEPASLTPVPPGPRQPDADWVVVAIGGARGITAETLRPLAEAGATLVLIGRSPLPEQEPDAFAGLDAAALRKHFIDDARAAGAAPRLVEIEGKVQGVLRQREMIECVGDLKALGARIVYREADTRNEAQVAALMAGLYDDYGRIDAAIVGAGVIEDRLLIDKDSASVSRVIDTKVDSAFLLARHIRPETLRFFCLFTSVAGRYGNAGQTDYAAANEILNRFAWSLQARWGPAVKVSAINWGPWLATTRGAGMVTAETRRKFEAKHVTLVAPEPGRRFLIDELRFAPTDQVEVTAGDAPWEFAEARFEAAGTAADAPPLPRGSAQPLIAGAQVRAARGDGATVLKTVDLVSDAYLDHHRLDGIPVMPLAVATEYMAEAVQAALPDRVVTGIDDVRLLRGIRLSGHQLPVRIKVGAPTSDGAVAVEMIADLESAPARLDYRATVRLASAGEPAPPPPLPPAPVGTPLSAGKAYVEWLFHGPMFQCVTELLTMTPQRIVARARPSDARRYCPPSGGGAWLFDPGLIDSAIQFMLVWSRAFRGSSVLPNFLTGVRRAGSEPLPPDLILDIDIASDLPATAVAFSFRVFDNQGRVRLWADRFEAAAAPDLNRLGGGWAGGRPDWMTT